MQTNCVAKGMADPMDCRWIETVPSSRLVSAHPSTSCSFYWRNNVFGFEYILKL